MEERITFVPCVKWVRKGIANSEINLGTSSYMKNTDHLEPTSVESESRSTHIENATSSAGTSMVDEYDFEHYDDDDDNPAVEGIDDAALGSDNLSVYVSNKDDQYITIKDSEDEDSEHEDDIIKPDDNLILVGHVDGDCSMLEVYVYNEKEDSLYVHHDIILPNIPLCLEVVSKNVTSSKNLVVVGGMEPVITVWDLDAVNSLKPIFKLGSKSKGKRKTKTQSVGHLDAVLDVSLNNNMTHILASGSADQTVILWDLETKKVARVLKYFNEKVQCLQWHPDQPSILLTGCCDKYTRMFDCRGDQIKKWKLTDEVERVLWNHYNNNSFIVSTSDGMVNCFDSRNEKALWSVKAHTKEVTGLSFSSLCSGLLFTAGSDGTLKAWDIRQPEPMCIKEKSLNLGTVHCLDSNPDLPFVVCAGGDDKSHYFGVWDVIDEDFAVERGFSVDSRFSNEIADCDKMDTTTATSAFESLSINNEQKNTK